VVMGRCRVKAAGGIREIHEVLEYLQAGARRFGSTRTDHFVRAFLDLPAEGRAIFGECVSRPAAVIDRS
jgi:deoxyribose-phosphate aldolase